MKKTRIWSTQVIDKDFYANFESQVADDTILDKLTQMNPDILQLALQVEKKMFADYNNMRVSVTFALFSEGDLKKKSIQFRTKAKRIQRFFGERDN